jgi:acetyl-CoA C-acetyltransferase
VDPERTPVVISAGQAASRDRSQGAVELASLAAADALSVSPRLGSLIERLTVVNILSRQSGHRPASVVAAAVGVRPQRCETTTVSGSTPQWLVQRAAADIAAGRLSATLITGAEAVRSGRLRPPEAGSAAPQPTKARSAPPHTSPAGAPLSDSPSPLEADFQAGLDEPPDPVIGDARLGSSEAEIDAGMLVPIHVYPIIESALAARDGRDPTVQRRFIGSFLARFTDVAAAHPQSWFPLARTPGEIATPSADNRLVAEPYTKLMTAFLGVSQGAAIVVTSLAVARSLGVDDGAMFVRSSASADDVWFPSLRPDLTCSPAITAAARAALEVGTVGLDELEFIDLYSCFPSAIQIGAAAVGLSLDDQRGLTVTGGLPYFGGPGSNYSTHAIATLLELLRERGGHGLVTALGWYVTKHAVGCYSATPPPNGYRTGDTEGEQAEIAASALIAVHRGEDLERQPAVVDGGTVVYGREGEVTAAPVIATLADGRRVVAAAAAGELPALAGHSPAGMQIEVGGSPPLYRVAEAVAASA